jgi:hypothetical protein
MSIDLFLGMFLGSLITTVWFLFLEDTTQIVTSIITYIVHKRSKQ